MTTTVKDDAAVEIRLPVIELERSRARAQNVLFGDDATVRVGRYELGDRLGAGGMGLVYRAFDPSLRRSVAVKVLRTGAGTIPATEASMQASLDDPAVARVYDVGTQGEVQFIAMELAEGMTVTEWLESEHRSKHDILTVFLAAAKILERVHAAGVIHRDFKPGNVVVGRNAEQVRLLDFGLAVDVGRSGLPVAGTPGYMAPEVLAGGVLSPRADQFAFCVSLGDALAEHSVSRRLRRTLRRGMSARASHRWPSMAAIVDALRRELRAPRRLFAASALVCGLAAGGVFVLSRGRLEPLPAPHSLEERRSARVDPLYAALATAKTDIAMGRAEQARALEEDARAALNADEWTAAVAYWVLGELEQVRGGYAEATRHYEDAAFLGLRSGNDRVVVQASCALVGLSDLRGLGPSASAGWMRQARSAQARMPPGELEIDVFVATGWRAFAAGKHQEAYAAFDRALETAVRTAGADAPVVPSLHYDLGYALVARRAFDPARAHFEAARAGWARTLGDDASVLALAWRGLGDVARGQGRLEEAVDAYTRGRSVLGGAGSSMKSAMLDVALADTLYRLGRDDEALTAYRSARAVLLPLNEHHRFLAAVEIGMGNLERDRTRWSEALAHFRRARDLSVEIEGPNSMNAAIASSSAAESAMNLERYDEAHALLTASIEARVALYGDDELSLAFPLTTMGELQRRRGEPSEAVTTLRRALELRNTADDVDTRLLAETQLALARAHEDLEHYGTALEFAAAARAGFDGPWEHAAEDVAMVDTAIARVRRAQGAQTP